MDQILDDLVFVGMFIGCKGNFGRDLRFEGIILVLYFGAFAKIIRKTIFGLSR
jgi:hypothetical protein